MLELLEPGQYYHIYNHANGKDNLFEFEGNYTFFMRQYKVHIDPVADTYCYCLMPNHFHLLLRVLDAEPLAHYFAENPKYLGNKNFLKLKKAEKHFQGFKNHEDLIAAHEPLSHLLSQQFSNLFNSYTKAFNKQQNRRGSLFMQNFRRKKVNNEKYFCKLIHYIHYNPVEHGFCEHPEDWKFSSYKAIISAKPTLVKKNEVIEWFEDLHNFIYCHKYEPKITGVEIW